MAAGVGVEKGGGAYYMAFFNNHDKFNDNNISQRETDVFNMSRGPSLVETERVGEVGESSLMMGSMTRYRSKIHLHGQVCCHSNDISNTAKYTFLTTV